MNADKALGQETLQRMIDVLRHRGPDGEGMYLDGAACKMQPGVALGHRRLAIIDLAGGKQPLGERRRLRVGRFQRRNL